MPTVPERFWDAHVKLMTRSEVLTEDDLVAVASDLGVAPEGDPPDEQAIVRAKARVDADEASARASGALITPTFFINGRRYDGPWDDSAFADAMLGTLGHRVRSAALDFVELGPFGGRPAAVGDACCHRARQHGRWDRPLPRSGNSVSDSLSTASASACRFCTGSTTGC